MYRGSEIKELRGSYVFGDFSRTLIPADGRLFHLAEDDEILELLPDGAAIGRHVIAFGQDRKGNLYVLSTENFAPVGSTGLLQRLVDG